MNVIKRLYNWMGAQVNAPYAESALALLFYLEAIFFLPTDPMLIIYCIERNDKAIRFATIATIASVFGGLTSYFIGITLWNAWGEQIIHNSFLNYIATPPTLLNAVAYYRKYDWIAIFIAGFSPVPYKVATLAAGFCKLNLLPFIIASFLARGARFYLYAIIIKLLGVRLKNSIEHYFNIIMISLVTLMAILFYFFRRI